MSLATLQGPLKKGNCKSATEAQAQTFAVPESTSRPVRKAVAKATSNAVWYAAQGKKRPTTSDTEQQEAPEPAKNRLNPKSSSSSSSSWSYGEKKQRQLAESDSGSQHQDNEDIDMEDNRSAQYVPPRLACHQDSSQRPLISGQRNRSPSSDGLSIPPITDDDHSSLFDIGQSTDDAADDDENGLDKNEEDEEEIVAPKSKARARTSIKSSLKPTVPGASVSKAQSVRAAKYAQEFPAFVAPVTVLKKEPAAPRIWSSEAQYVPPSPGQRLISKRTQSSEIQDVLTKATATSTGLFLLEDAYPDAACQSSMLRDALALAATELGLDELAEQLCTPSERKWAKSLCDYVFNRVVHVRSEVKKAAEAVILDTRPPPEFDDVIVSGLPGPAPLPGETDKEPATEPGPPKIVTKRVERVYTPDYLNVNSLELTGGAYKHGAIIATLRTMFSGTASPGQVLLPLFSSSLDDERYSEPELPMSMLVLAAAAVHFCLREWSSGSHSTVDFKGDKARPEYKKHVDYLLKIQADNAVSYHVMMVELLNRATEPVDGDESDGLPDVY
ncbi:hypothetical protein BT96DRAFT_981135 [Gymnopus androsaceus JB14]|uniref:DUF6532 domain-containing protein n=1 Tax=Gymnopus androsaceus JB14 TaxID=1447944 RepID=A0A6A4GS54_9AGAR|nr:hypothetical protein BT96DRAFT_981135 [Gymnopus androsaceus JB14]